MTKGLDPVARLRWLLANDGLRRPEVVQGNGSDDDRIMTLALRYESVARSLDVSPRTVRRMVASGELPVVRVGGMRRVRMRDLWNYVDGLPADDEKETT